MGIQKPSSFSQFVNVDKNVSNRRLAFSMWYLHHAALFRRIGGIIFVICAIALSICALVSWGWYLFVGYGEDKRLEHSFAQFPNYVLLHEFYAPASIRTSAAEVFSAGNQLYDFSSTVVNESSRYVATVSYYFSLGSTSQTPTRSIQVLPGQTTLLSEYGVSSSRVPSSIRLVVDSVRWRRIDPHRLQNVTDYVTERLDFSVENVSFSPASRLEGIETNQVRFDIVNNSVYSYFEPIFFVEFLDNGRRSGIYYLEFDTISALERIPVDLRTFADAIQVTDVRVYPMINIFDTTVFISPGS